MNQGPRTRLFRWVVLLFWFAQYAYVPNLSAYAQEQGASLTMIGLITGSYGLGQMLCRIPIGLWSDRIQRRKIFVQAGFLFALLSSLLFLLFPDPWMILAARSIAGVAASTWVITTVLYAAYFDEQASTNAISQLTAYNYGGQLLSMLCAGLLLQRLTGYQGMFVVSAVGAVLGLLLSSQITECVPQRKEALSLRALLQVAVDRRLLLISLSMLIAQVFVQSTIFGFTPLLANDLGANAMERSVLSMVNVAMAVIGSMISGRSFVHRMGEARFLCTCVLIFALAALCIPGASHLVVLYLLQGVTGLAQGGMFSLQMGLAIRHFPGEKRGTSMGLYQAIYGIGMFIGPMIAGAVGDQFGLAVSYRLLAGLCLLMIPLNLAWGRENRR